MGGNGHMTGEVWRPDLYSDLTSWVHLWDTRPKIIALVIFVFGVVSLNSFITVLLSFLSVLVVATSSRIPFLFIVKRVKWVLPFLVFIFVGLILGRGLTSFNDSIYFAGVVSIKALTSITATFLLLGTQSLEDFLKGLSHLRPPQIIISVLFLSYRYIYMFREIFLDTYRSVLSRGFTNKFDKQTLAVYGDITGALFLKALDRSEVILKAMEARGFDGVLPVKSIDGKGIRTKDIIKTLGVISVTALLLWLDWSVV